MYSQDVGAMGDWMKMQMGSRITVTNHGVWGGRTERPRRRQQAPRQHDAAQAWPKNDSRSVGVDKWRRLMEGHYEALAMLALCNRIIEAFVVLFDLDLDLDVHVPQSLQHCFHPLRAYGRMRGFSSKSTNRKRPFAQRSANKPWMLAIVQSHLFPSCLDHDLTDFVTTDLEKAPDPVSDTPIAASFGSIHGGRLRGFLLCYPFPSWTMLPDEANLPTRERNRYRMDFMGVGLRRDTGSFINLHRAT